MRHIIIILLVLISCNVIADSVPTLDPGEDEFGVPTAPNDTRLSLLDLTNDSMTNLACVNYRVGGVCIWLKCVAIKCSIKTSMIVEHNNPDILVEVNQTDKYPLNPVSGFYTKAASNITKAAMGGGDMGQGNQSGTSATSKNLQFHDAVAMGNPALPIFSSTVGSILGTVGWCGSDVTLYNPYFISMGSPEWRANWVEGPMWVPNALRTIGSSISGQEYWGSVYPRIGFVHHADTFKSSATIAQRVADIIGNNSLVHVSQSLPNTSSGNLTWKPIKIKEMDMNNSVWQLNYPRGYSSQCQIFPNQLSSIGIKSETKNYVWTLWRRYKCCSIKGSLITTTMW